MTINSVHTLIATVAGVLIGVMAICLFSVSMPRDNRLRNYRISRYVLAVGFLILSAACFLALCIGLSHTADTDPMVKTVTLITASLQAMMYEFTILALINPMFPTLRRVMRSLGPMVIVDILLVCAYVWGSEQLFIWVFYTAWCVYIMQLIIYVWLFRREYADYREAMNNYFSDDCGPHLKWIRTAYYLAVGLGIAAGVSLLLESVSFAIFMGLMTVFYVYYAIRYIGYSKKFANLAPALEPVFEEIGDASNSREKIPELVNEWIAAKSFATPGITLEQMAAELGVNRSALALYMSRDKARTFRRWITELRIEEARELIMTNPSTQLSKVSDSVGIRSRRMFHRSFMRITGEDACDFRDRMLSVRKD